MSIIIYQLCTDDLAGVLIENFEYRKDAALILANDPEFYEQVKKGLESSIDWDEIMVDAVHDVLDEKEEDLE